MPTVKSLYLTMPIFNKFTSKNYTILLESFEILYSICTVFTQFFYDVTEE